MDCLVQRSCHKGTGTHNEATEFSHGRFQLFYTKFITPV